jgi:hypothetical protein
MPENLGLKDWPGLNERYVLCEGTFNADCLGHMASNSGAIVAVQRLEVWLGHADALARINESELRADPCE